MNRMKTKRRIYLQNYCTLLVVYLVLMIAFSVYELNQHKITENLKCGYHAQRFNNTIDDILEENIGRNNQIMNMSNVTKELLQYLYYIQSSEIEIAVFDRDYNLIYSANDNWICSYMVQLDENTYSSAFGYFDPHDWFDEEVVTELESYLSAKPNAKEVGDLVGYSIQLDSFWVNDVEIIPSMISVVPLYASGFDEYGNILSSLGEGDGITYKSNYATTSYLPYYINGTILTNNGRNDQHDELRSMVTDKDKLQRAVELSSEFASYERINPVSYRYYTIIPYQNTFKMDEADSDSYYSDFWTVVGFRINLLDKCKKTLIIVWVSCLMLFAAAATILSKLMYRSSRAQELDVDQREALDDMADELNGQNLNQRNILFEEIPETIKPDSEVAPPRYEEVSLGEVCRKMIKRYDRLCKDNYITVSLEGEALVIADVWRMESVIDSFFMIALEYTHYCGAIRIHIYEKTLEFHFSCNTISEDILHEIWKLHNKADTSQSGMGFGLKLSAAAKTLERYHFTYGAKNSEDGVVFWFRW